MTSTPNELQQQIVYMQRIGVTFRCLFGYVIVTIPLPQGDGTFTALHTESDFIKWLDGLIQARK